MSKTKKRRTNPKKATAILKEIESSDLVQAPHTFVIHRGLSCEYLVDLTRDFRKIMEPFTAVNLHEKKTNRIKDFVSMSSYFHVSHMVILNKAATQLSFKILRLPRGPTLTFKVHQFTLARDVLSMHKRQFVDDEIFKHAPLVIMNNFTAEGKHMKLMATTLQNMFPPINLAQVTIATIRRCVLFSYTPLTNLIEMRHYSIQIAPVGLSRPIKKLVLGKIPNLSKCEDISDFIVHEQWLLAAAFHPKYRYIRLEYVEEALKGAESVNDSIAGESNANKCDDGAVSDSEIEDDEEAHVLLPQILSRRGNIEHNKSAIKLHEIGPRLTLQLIKIEEGLLTGEVLYHDHITRTEEEKEALRKQIEKKQKLKEQRKKLQASNRERNLNAKKKKNAFTETYNEDQEPDDDAAYYKEEVGEEPDEELFKPNCYNGNKRPKLPLHLKHTLKRLKSKKNDHKK